MKSETRRSPLFNTTYQLPFLTSSLENTSSSDFLSANSVINSIIIDLSPSVSSLSTKYIKFISKMEGIIKSVPTFYGRKDDYEDPTEYLKIINFVVNKRYTDGAKASIIKRLVFRSRLKDDILS